MHEYAWVGKWYNLTISENIRGASYNNEYTANTPKSPPLRYGDFAYSYTLCEMHVLLLGYRPALKKNLNFVFLFIRKGYKVFSPLRYENDLFIRGKRIQ